MPYYFKQNWVSTQQNSPEIGEWSVLKYKFIFISMQVSLIHT